MLKLNNTSSPASTPATPQAPAQDITATEPPAGGGSSADGDIAALEKDLLNGSKPGEESTPEPAAPTPGGEPAAGGAPTPEGGDGIKAIQQLTGQLAQQMRQVGDQLQGIDIKAAINSIIAASDLSKLDPADKKDITNKIANAGAPAQGEPAAPAAPTPAPTPPVTAPVAESLGAIGVDPSNYAELEQGVDNTPARFTASGGQTVGEEQLNERLMTILERAKANVIKNMKKN